MRILITSGIFEPEGGGPATYAARLAERLARSGHSVMVVALSNKAHYENDSRYPFALLRVTRTNKLLYRIKLLLHMLRLVPRYDIVYTLDWFAVGLPVSVACRLFRTPYVVRVGGDYAWERYMARGGKPMTLRDFYAGELYAQPSLRSFSALIVRVLLQARAVVFNSSEQKDLYESHYELDERKLVVVENPVPRKEFESVRRAGSTHEFVYWGRLVAAKNIDGLLRAFARAKLPASYTLAVIGDGPERRALERLTGELGIAGRVVFERGRSQREALERVRNARAFVLPSWTDFSPNQVYEALAIGLPALVTSENFLRIRKDLPATLDPNSVDDIAAELEMLADDARYAEFSRAFNAIKFDRSWEDVAKEHVMLFKKICASSK